MHEGRTSLAKTDVWPEENAKLCLLLDGVWFLDSLFNCRDSRCCRVKWKVAVFVLHYPVLLCIFCISGKSSIKSYQFLALLPFPCCLVKVTFYHPTHKCLLEVMIFWQLQCFGPFLSFWIGDAGDHAHSVLCLVLSMWRFLLQSTVWATVI